MSLKVFFVAGRGLPAPGKGCRAVAAAAGSPYKAALPATRHDFGPGPGTNIAVRPATTARLHWVRSSAASSTKDPLPEFGIDPLRLGSTCQVSDITREIPKNCRQLWFSIFPESSFPTVVARASVDLRHPTGGAVVSTVKADRPKIGNS
jgi:hypothetical protein